ncbi:Flp family type IVb pilin [Methylopila sp. 73B]|uniref:Flp family type IVb pilin n=1 Tax=Methylopila sp. 73B TaxID=1120792 RepID=UPI000369AE27|nr:Flp family type IVb pilin [Methylopila sp. 73B]
MAGQVQAALRRFARDERGATAIEYALIASVMAVALVATVFVLGDVVRVRYFERIANEFRALSGG